jgi:alkylation response protein AidB-like acyl-CoA dehydrogenase
LGCDASRQCIAGGGYAAGNPCAALERAAVPHPQGPIGGRAGMPMTLPVPSRIFTIFEGTSEIQRMLIGRAVTGLDVR